MTVAHNAEVNEEEEDDASVDTLAHAIDLRAEKTREASGVHEVRRWRAKLTGY